MAAETIDEASRRITAHITTLECFKNTQTLFLYAAFQQEIQTKYLDRMAKKQGKKVAYPKILPNQKEVSFYEVPHLEELEAEAFKTMVVYEPNPKLHRQVLPMPGDLMIIPGLAFDFQGSRIGYGGGFYDRYLKKYDYLYKLAVCMDFQLFEWIMTESFDVKMDCIVTPVRCHLPFL